MARNTLLTVIRNIKRGEKWRRMMQCKDRISSIGKTKKGTLKIRFAKGNTVYVLQRNKNLYATAVLLKKGMHASVAARQQWGRLFCTKLHFVSQEDLLKYTKISEETNKEKTVIDEKAE